VLAIDVSTLCDKDLSTLCLCDHGGICHDDLNSFYCDCNMTAYAGETCTEGQFLRSFVFFFSLFFISIIFAVTFCFSVRFPGRPAMFQVH